MQWRRSELLFPAGLFLVLIGIGASIGLTDDEAYHWVLAQRPALGYAYHPPGMAWFVAASRALLSPFSWIASNSEFAVRLPAALTMATLLGLAIRWVGVAGAKGRSLKWGALGILSFAGLFSLGWMMVPDTPLFLGWIVAFTCSWQYCTVYAGEAGADGTSRKNPGALWGLGVTVGCALAILGKFSGVLVPGSVLWVALTLAPKERRWSLIGWATLGGALATLPILIWNAQHEWGSILFQIRDRHGDHSLSLVRYGRFWAVSLLVAGPMILGEVFALFRPGLDRPRRFLQAWTVPPALIFLTQPLWSDFKPHWAFIVWWPAALAFGLRLASHKGPQPLWARAQVAYALALWAVVTAALFDPVGTRLYAGMRGAPPNPLLDVTNDLYGWSSLPEFLRVQNIPDAMPVIGSRYQTASQAAFALASADRVSLVPRDLKARDEWAVLAETDGYGPGWPRLLAPVIFVADMRYDEGPGFPQADCAKLGRVETRRAGFLAKWIDVWRCEPRPQRP